MNLCPAWNFIRESAPKHMVWSYSRGRQHQLTCKDAAHVHHAHLEALVHQLQRDAQQQLHQQVPQDVLHPVRMGGEVSSLGKTRVLMGAWECGGVTDRRQ